MREEWYVVPTRYALRLREVEDPLPQCTPSPGDDDRLLSTLLRETPAPAKLPRRKLPRKSSGRALK